MAQSLGGVRTIYADERDRADGKRRVYVVPDRIRAHDLSLLQDGGSAVCLSLEFCGQKMCVISPVTRTAAFVGRAVTLALGTPSPACSDCLPHPHRLILCSSSHLFCDAAHDVRCPQDLIAL